jgi:hypothetical protein
VKLPNKNNLVPIKNLSNDEAKRRGQKGGIASAEARRKKKAFKEQIEYFLSLPFPDVKDKNGNELRKTFEKFGIEETEIDNQMAMILSLWRSVINKGDTSAFIALRDTVGEKPVEKVSNDVNVTYESALKEISGSDEY